jgi:dienelactone hydrolase
VTGKRLIRWFLKIIAAIAVFIVASMALLLILMSREHKTELNLPRPTGHFAVGRTTYAWVNNAERDESAPDAGTKRQEVVWIWYPAAFPNSAATADYLPPAWRVAEARHSGVLMSRFLTRDPALVKVHSTSSPAVSSEQPSYPVVIMRAGGGALTTDFTTLAEDLASHGYIVVGFDAPFRTSFVVLPEGRVIERPAADNPENLDAVQANRLINRLLPMWVGDTKFVVSQLEHLNADQASKFGGRLDMRRLGMFGHSFGGATTMQFCHEDDRCQAGIDIDGAPYGTVVQEGLQQPFMFILSDHSRDLSDPAGRQIMNDIQNIYARLPHGRFLITIRGAHHFSFSDQALVKSQYLIKLLTSFAGVGKLDPRRGLAITATYTHTFFDVYLKGAPASLLSGLSAQYPEVKVEPR